MRFEAAISAPDMKPDQARSGQTQENARAAFWSAGVPAGSWTFLRPGRMRRVPCPYYLRSRRCSSGIAFFHALEASMTKRAAIKRQTREMAREHGVLDSRQFMEDAKVRRLPTHAGWSPYPSNDDREQGYLKTLKPKSDGQAELMTAIDHHNMVLALGPAGTGKTYLAVAKAVEALEAGKVGRIVLSRPAVEAGESIGFLPGDMEDKLAPYLRPLYDALSDRLSMKRVRALMAEGLIEIAPVGYMRGRTLNNAFVVIDEAQNCTYVQLKMLLTRLGWHSTMVVTGDPNQSDLLPGVSGLSDIAE